MNSLACIVKDTKKTFESLNPTKRFISCVEVSSHTWGYSRPDSDHDMHFLYHGSIKDYLTSREKYEESFNFASTIPTKNPVGFVGWDLKKALMLAESSNPSLLEHIAVAYQDENHSELIKALKIYVSLYYSPYTLAQAYITTARHHLLHDYNKFAGDINKQAKHLFAGMRNLSLAEKYGQMYDGIRGFVSLYTSEHLMMYYYDRVKLHPEIGCDLLSQFRENSLGYDFDAKLKLLYNLLIDRFESMDNFLKTLSDNDKKALLNIQPKEQKRKFLDDVFLSQLNLI